MLVLRFTVTAAGLPPRDDQIMLGDPLMTQAAPAVYACEVTLGAGTSRAIFGGSPISALANAVTVATALVESQGEVLWK